MTRSALWLSRVVGPLIIGVLLSPSMLAAATLTGASVADKGSISFVVNNVTVLDGEGGVHPESALWVKDGKVHSIQPSAKAPPAWADRVVDGKAGFIVPGFIELSTQLGLFEVSAEESANDTAYDGHSETPALNAVDAFNPNNSHIAVARDGGVTMVMSGPQAGLLSGRALVVGLGPTGLQQPSADAAMMADVRVRAPYGNNRAGVFLRLHEIADAVAAYKKAPEKYQAYSRGPGALSGRQLAALIPVFSGRMPLVVSVDRESDIRALLRFVDARAALRQRVNLVICSGAEAWRVRDVLAKRKIPVILTPSAQDPSTFDRLRARDDAAAVLKSAGVQVALSSATWANNVRRLRHEAGLAIANGLSPEDALAAITLVPAEILGRQKTHGSLRPKKVADFTLFDGDPLDVTSRPQLLVIAGRQVPLRSRQRALAEKYR